MRTYLGQNFLKDASIARKIVAAAGITAEDLVVEIGPGRGALTEFIAASGARETVAVEIDERLSEPLSRKYPSVKFVAADALKTDFRALTGGGKAVFVGNLPYCSATAIMTSVIGGDCWKKAVFMFQKEVARRITAGAPGAGNFRPKEPGYLSILAQYYSRPEILFDVAPGSFSPRPAVVSSVVSFTPSGRRTEFAGAAAEKFFFDVVGAAFSKRRKTIANSLSSLAGHDKKSVIRALETARIKPGERAENLRVADFIKLASVLSPI